MESTFTLKQVSKEALSLNGLDRAKLAEMLITSLDSDTLTSIDNSWIQTASKRRGELISGKVKSINGTKALRHARKKLK